MLNQTLDRIGATVLGVALVLALAGPAAAGTIFSWRTDDGNVAFTDDAKNVPERYRGQVVKRETRSLSEYRRYTSKHAEGTADYEKQLAERVARLRAFNATPADPGRAPNPLANGRTEIDVGGVSLDVDGRSGDEPVIVERVRVRGRGQLASRHDTVVRQGDRTLAILRGNQEGEVGGPSNVIRDDRITDLYR